MAEEIKEEEKLQKCPTRMTDEAIAFLAGLADELENTFNEVAKVLAKKSCNRAETALIKAHGVILKSKLTELHKKRIAELS